MRHHIHLGALLPAIAGAVLVAGCGGSVTPLGSAEGASSSPAGSGSGVSKGAQGSSGASGSLADFDLDVCTGEEHRLLEGVTRSDGTAAADGAVDYMELRDEFEYDGTSRVVAVAKQGTPCAFSSQATKCRQDLAALRSPAGWNPFSYGMEPARHRYLVWTTQDAIGTVTSLDALRDFVKVVENVKDAALLATATGEYRFVCDGTKNAKQTATGWALRVQSGHDCGEYAKVEEHVFDVSSTGEVTIAQTKLVKKGEPQCTIGRRPEGLASTSRAHACEESVDAVGRFFADAAHLEAASIVAFERLATELSALGAPRELVESALASRDDEIRHARMTAKAAARRGGRPTAPVVAPIAERTMLEIALENAVEGCVRETYGALVAHHQAMAASDPSIAAMMRVIAEDETRHAGLAWDVAAWLEPRLSADERMAVASARAEALEELRSALAFEPAPELEEVAGMPAASRATALLDALEGHFIQPALAAVA
jgi:hypothetical protein